MGEALSAQMKLASGYCPWEALRMHRISVARPHLKQNLLAPENSVMRDSCISDVGEQSAERKGMYLVIQSAFC
jgi:hypothetical protein